MSSRGPNFLKQLWYRYKSLRLPWRRQFLAGADLAGNTFWEFRDQLNAGRWRRIVKYSRQRHYGDVKISPQWHQWLRHTRPEAPTIQEQQYEVSRQETMKQLAAKADERWKSIPSYLDSPARQQPTSAIGITDSKPADPSTATENDGVESVVEGPRDRQKDAAEDTQEMGTEAGTEARRKRERGENPWKQAQQGAPGENWQHAAWSPGVAQRR